MKELVVYDSWKECFDYCNFSWGSRVNIGFAYKKDRVEEIWIREFLSQPYISYKQEGNYIHVFDNIYHNEFFVKDNDLKSIEDGSKSIFIIYYDRRCTGIAYNSRKEAENELKNLNAEKMRRMTIKIPEGEDCEDCPFSHFSLSDDCPEYQCGYFFKSWSKDNSKIKECLQEFGDNGGEFELVRKEGEK